MAAVLDFGLIILRQTRLKRSAFVGPEILGLFVSTMIADEIKFSLNLWSLHKFLYIFKEKDKAHSLSISEIIDSEIHGCLNVKKSCLRTISSSQCVNRSLCYIPRHVLQYHLLVDTLGIYCPNFAFRSQLSTPTYAISSSLSL